MSQNTVELYPFTHSSSSDVSAVGEVAARHMGVSNRSVFVKIKASNPASYIVSPSSMWLRPGQQDIFKFHLKKQSSRSRVVTTNTAAVGPFMDQSFSKSSGNSRKPASTAAAAATLFSSGEQRLSSRDKISVNSGGSSDLSNDRFLVIAIEVDQQDRMNAGSQSSQLNRLRESELFSNLMLKQQQRITLNVRLKQPRGGGGGGGGGQSSNPSTYQLNQHSPSSPKSMRKDSSQMNVPPLARTSSTSSKMASLNAIPTPSSAFAATSAPSSEVVKVASSQLSVAPHSHISKSNMNNSHSTPLLGTMKNILASKVSSVRRKTSESEHSFKVEYEQLVQKVLEFEKNYQKLYSEIKQAETYRRTLSQSGGKTKTSTGSNSSSSSITSQNNLTCSIFMLTIIILLALISGAFLAVKK